MKDRAEVWLFLAQRMTAAVMAPLVVIHIITIIYAVRGGLTAAEILSRTQGSAWWRGAYGVFVVAAAIHAGIGLRTIAREMTPWRGISLDAAAAAYVAVALVLGMTAVGAVT